MAEVGRKCSPASSIADVAAELAERLALAAHWTGDGCRWLDATAATSVAGAAGAGALYAGASGTALFLAESHRLAPNVAVHRAACGGLLHALRSLDTLSPRASGFGFGPTGTLWAGLRAARALGEPAIEARVDQAIAHHLCHPTATLAHDVLSGRAGAVLGWLAIGTMTRTADCLRAADAVGQSLLATAMRHPRGWAWGRPRETASVASLLGFAHGTSGVIAALAALRDATGSLDYAYAVERGLAYEDQFYDPRARAWLDVRHPELETLAGQLARGLLAPRQLAELTIHPGAARYAYAWCHGVPGILFERLATVRASQSPALDSRSTAALRALHRRAFGSDDLSLCHGLAGFADLMLEASRVLMDPELATEATRIAERLALHVAQRMNMHDGSLAAESPGMFTGLAGVGYTLLRHADASLPSVLAGGQSALAPPATERPVREAIERMQHEEEAARFRQTLRVLAARAPARAPRAQGVADRGVRRVISRAMKDERSARWRRLLRDASRVERACWDIAHLPFDPWADFAAPLVLAHGSVLEAGDHVALAPTARVVRCRYDWSSWSGGAEPACRPIAHLVWRIDGETRSLPVDALTVALCDRLAHPTTVAALLDGLPFPPGATDRLRAAADRRVHQLWRWGALHLSVDRTLPGRHDVPSSTGMAGPHPRDAAVLPEAIVGRVYGTITPQHWSTRNEEAETRS